MKPKRRLFIIVLVVAVIGLYLVARVTGMLQVFNVPTAGNLPGITPGENVLVSNLVSPKRYDFIVFNYYDSMEQQKLHYVFRLCGIPGDTVEIRNGDLYVNNQNTSDMFDRCLAYNATPDDGLKANQVLNLRDEHFQIAENKAELILSKEEVAQIKSLNIPVERKILSKEYTDEYISRIYGKPWNTDHFGPLVIPPDRYFVLGDNRYRAQDSRYTGLIPFSDFYGTVISK